MRGGLDGNEGAARGAREQNFPSDLRSSSFPKTWRGGERHVMEWSVQEASRGCWRRLAWQGRGKGGIGGGRAEAVTCAALVRDAHVDI